MKDKLPPSILHAQESRLRYSGARLAARPAAPAADGYAARRARAAYPDCFEPRCSIAICKHHLERRVNLGYHLWGLMILFLWMKKWRIQATPLSGHAIGFGHRKELVSLPSVLLFAAAVYLGCIVSPPSLMDDVDCRAGANRAQHARLRRLGHGAAGRRRLSGKAAAHLLDDGRSPTRSSACTIGRRACPSRFRAWALPG